MNHNNLYRIRMAEQKDAQEILAIYAPYVKDTAITLTSVVPSVKDIRNKMNKVKKNYPYLVCTYNNKVVGFAFAYRDRPHEACCWNAELSIYLDPGFHGRGMAKALYTALFQILKAQGFCNLYAVITLPNDPSVALHKHFGFKELAVHKDDGFKLGRWRDVLWLLLRIEGSDPEVHGPPTPLKKLRDNEIDTALMMATALLVGAQ